MSNTNSMSYIYSKIHASGFQEKLFYEVIAPPLTVPSFLSLTHPSNSPFGKNSSFYSILGELSRLVGHQICSRDEEKL